MLAKFTDLDLAQPLQPIYVDSRYSWLLVVVRWGYHPLGMLRFPSQDHSRTITIQQLQAEVTQAFGWRLWEQMVAGTYDDLYHADRIALPPISVAVCTRDRPLSLERCLKALKQIDYPEYEVMVIDNGSRDPAVAEVVGQSGFRYVREDIPGLDWARNRGIEEASFDIIAYIDDDALATPGWLRGVANGFGDAGVMAVTGLVLPAELETSAQNDFEDYGGMGKGFEGFTVRPDGLDRQALFWASNWGVGANMAFRRCLFDAVGDFDVALDVGTPTNGGGDIEFFYRIVSAGYTLRYEPAAIVYHVHRRDDESLRRQVYSNGRSFSAYLLTIARNEPDKRTSVLWFALRWWLWGWLLRRTIRSVLKRDRSTLRFSFVELLGACSALKAFRESNRLASTLKEKLAINQ